MVKQHRTSRRLFLALLLAVCSALALCACAGRLPSAPVQPGSLVPADGEREESGLQEEDYYDTMEQALASSRWDIFDNREYLKQIDQRIKEFDGEEYASLYYRSVSDSELEGLTFCKFRKISGGDGEKYALLSVTPVENKKNARYTDDEERLVRGLVMMSGTANNYSVTPGKRLIWGCLRSERVYGLAIGKKRPDEIIPFDMFGEKRYFWYLETPDDAAPEELEVELPGESAIDKSAGLSDNKRTNV